MGAEFEAVKKRTLAGFSEGSSIFAFESKTVRSRVYSIMHNFTPRLGGYGGRLERDRVFGDAKLELESLSIRQENRVEMDDNDDDIPWADLVEEELGVDCVCNLLVAFD